MNIKIKCYGSGYPLVFFHGWGFDSQIWLSLLRLLGDEYTLILVDLPGFGHTPIMDWPHFKEQLLHAVPEQFALIGWSMGGLYASRLAIEEPERVTHLLNVTSSPRFLADAAWSGVAKEVFVQFYQNLSRDPRATLHDFLELHVRKDTVKLSLGQLPSTEGLAAGLHVLDSWDLRSSIAAVNIPVAYMFGRLDPIVPIATMKVMQEVYPEFHYVLFHRAAHMPFLSHADLFVDEVRRFIR